MRHLIAIPLLLACALVEAGTARISFTAPTVYADEAKTPIPAGTTLQYRVYEVGGTTPVLVMQSAVAAPASTFTVPDNCFVRGYQVTTALPGGTEGVRSDIAVLVSGCVPGAVTNLTITK